MRSKLIEVIERLKSRRNEVLRVRMDGEIRIQKTFVRADDFAKERDMLVFLAKEGVAVPQILACGRQTLWLADLGDVTLLHWLEEAERDESIAIEPMLQRFIWYLCSFYRATGGVKAIGDVNFRNFLFFDDRIYGVDFELVRDGRAEDDIGRILAFCVTYSPRYTAFKYRFCRSFLSACIACLGCDKSAVKAALLAELLAMESRRDMGIPVDAVLSEIGL